MNSMLQISVSFKRTEAKDKYLTMTLLAMQPPMPCHYFLCLELDPYSLTTVSNYDVHHFPQVLGTVDEIEEFFSSRLELNYDEENELFLVLRTPLRLSKG